MSEGNIFPSNAVAEEDNSAALVTNEALENVGVINSNDEFHLER